MTINKIDRKWIKIIQKWQKTQLSKAEFCRQNKINLRQFSYHSIKHNAFCDPERKNDVLKNGDKDFAKVVCDENTNSPSRKEIAKVNKFNPLIMYLECKASIEINDHFNPESLKKILQITASL